MQGLPCLSFSQPGLQAQEGEVSFEQAQYEACLALISRNAEAAYEGRPCLAGAGRQLGRPCTASRLPSSSWSQQALPHAGLESTAEGAVVATDATRARSFSVRLGDAWIAAREYAFLPNVLSGGGTGLQCRCAGLALVSQRLRHLQENWEVFQERPASDRCT